MKILFWVPYPTEGPSNRYRVEQYLPYIKKEGIVCYLHPFWSSSAFRVLYKRGYYFRKVYFFILGTLLRILDLLQIFKYDLVFIHREAYPIGGVFFETILSILKKHFIFDFDDAIFLPASSRSNSFIGKFKNPNKVAKTIKLSSYVIVGNQYLADFALEYNPKVYVIPTPIDTDRYYPIKDNKESDDKIVIGWMGSITTINFLNMLEDAFIQLSKRFPDIIIKIVGGDFFIKGLGNVISKQWLFNEEIEDLKTFDMGIMPMPDNQWTKGKCGFKAILYMSMGIPTISSCVGVNKEIITDGVNGFLADTEREWVQKLTLLIEDRELRKRIGFSGRVTVEERYSVKVNAPKLLSKLHQITHI